MDITLNTLQVDALRELASTGSGNAATALAKMVGQLVELQVPEVHLQELRGIAASLGGANAPVVAVHLGIRGKARGDLWMLLGEDTAAPLADLLLRRPMGDSRPLQQIEESALGELGNILAGSYLTALSHLTDILLMPSVPVVRHTTVGEVLTPNGVAADVAILASSVLSVSKTRFALHLILVPDPATLRVILASLGVVG